VLFHTLPSRAMTSDALAQYLRGKGWLQVLVLQGSEEADAEMVAAFGQAAVKLGLEIVAERSFVLGNDPRQRDQTNVPLLTGEPDHDVVFIADTVGEFGRYVPFATYRPRPVVGTEGLVPSGWHWTWERHGAPQLNQRFDRLAERDMEETDWAAWAAVKSVVEAIVRTGTTAVEAIRAHLTSDAFNLDTYKGNPGSFRPWSHQLRQPILLHTHNAVIERAPMPKFLHATNVLDTLGLDAPETECEWAN
jgi:ABC transporter substrate binding protein (PQQ-dependent alcohol dehydrogenase system)